MTAVADDLRHQLARNRALGLLLDEPDTPLVELDYLQQWQRERLASTYRDLLGEPCYTAAGHFFLDELYGGLDFRDRDREVAQVAPVMIRLLPQRALKTMAEAFELQAVSLELDLAVALAMSEAGLAALDEASYGECYRAAGESELRDRQIDLILKLGTDLGHHVRKPMLLKLVRLMRAPAHAAGFGKLQEFLEQGLTAFRAMGDAQPFVECVYQREGQIRQRLLAGEPRPFDVVKEGI